jgi:hypothetical protein
MKEYFKKLISSTDPESAMRWVLIFIVVFTAIVFWGTWLIISIINSQAADIPSGTATAYATVNGSAIAGKIVQKFAEAKKE